MCNSTFYNITIVSVIDTLNYELRQESVCTAIIAHLSVGKTPDERYGHRATMVCHHLHLKESI